MKVGVHKEPAIYYIYTILVVVLSVIHSFISVGNEHIYQEHNFIAPIIFLFAPILIQQAQINKLIRALVLTLFLADLSGLFFIDMLFFKAHTLACIALIIILWSRGKGLRMLHSWAGVLLFSVVFTYIIYIVYGLVYGVNYTVFASFQKQIILYIIISVILYLFTLTRNLTVTEMNVGCSVIFLSALSDLVLNYHFAQISLLSESTFILIAVYILYLYYKDYFVNKRESPYLLVLSTLIISFSFLNKILQLGASLWFEFMLIVVLFGMFDRQRSSKNKIELTPVIAFISYAVLRLLPYYYYPLLSPNSWFVYVFIFSLILIAIPFLKFIRTKENITTIESPTININGLVITLLITYLLQAIYILTIYGNVFEFTINKAAQAINNTQLGLILFLLLVLLFRLKRPGVIRRRIAKYVIVLIGIGSVILLYYNVANYFVLAYKLSGSDSILFLITQTVGDSIFLFLTSVLIIRKEIWSRFWDVLLFTLLIFVLSMFKVFVLY